MPVGDGGSDKAVLDELGGRLRGLRLQRNLSQAQLAGEAGVGRVTVQRLEQGESASLTSLIRILRALDAMAGLEQLVPAPAPSPIDELRREGRQRRRARPPQAERAESQPGPWRWGDEGSGDGA